MWFIRKPGCALLSALFSVPYHLTYDYHININLYPQIVNRKIVGNVLDSVGGRVVPMSLRWVLLTSLTGAG